MEGIIFIGIQGSGKSTFYRENFLNSHIRLSMDMLKARHREDILIRACITSKQPFVLDNTNPTRADRKPYINILKEHNFKIKRYFFRSQILDCLERNKLRVSKAFIPEVGIRGTHSKLELPSYNEGFDELFFISLDDKKFLIDEWKDEV